MEVWLRHVRMEGEDRHGSATCRLISEEDCRVLGGSLAIVCGAPLVVIIIININNNNNVRFPAHCRDNVRFAHHDALVPHRWVFEFDVWCERRDAVGVPLEVKVLHRLQNERRRAAVDARAVGLAGGGGRRQAGITTSHRHPPPHRLVCEWFNHLYVTRRCRGSSQYPSFSSPLFQSRLLRRIDGCAVSALVDGAALDERHARDDSGDEHPSVGGHCVDGACGVAAKRDYFYDDILSLARGTKTNHENAFSTRHSQAHRKEKSEEVLFWSLSHSRSIVFFVTNVEDDDAEDDDGMMVLVTTSAAAVAVAALARSGEWSRGGGGGIAGGAISAGGQTKKTRPLVYRNRNASRAVESSQKRRRGRLHPTPAPPTVEGSAVDEYCRVLRGGQTSRDALRDAVARVIAPEPNINKPTSSSSSSSSISSGRLLLTLIDAQYRHAYDLQVAALVDSNDDDKDGWPVELTPGLHAVGHAIPPAALAQLEGFRAGEERAPGLLHDTPSPMISLVK